MLKTLERGNSVDGLASLEYLSRALHLHVFDYYPYILEDWLNKRKIGKPPCIETKQTGVSSLLDGRVAWYGTFPLLAFAKANDCSLRSESAEVAADLQKALEDSTMPPALSFERKFAEKINYR